MRKVSRYSTAFLCVMMFSISAYSESQPQTTDDWQVRFKPYFWMPSLDADSTVSGLSGSVELNFGDVLDYLDMTAMGQVEVWNGKWGFVFDGVYMNLGADGTFEGTRGVVTFDLDADVRLGMADFALYYRLFEQPLGDDNKLMLTFEPYGGLRYGYLRQKIDLNVNIAGVGSAGRTLGTSEDWVEPFIGGRIIWDLNEKWSLNVRGDAGGFGIGSASNLTWQVLGGIDYKLSENTTLNAGYRYVDLDYSRGSGANEFGIDLKAQGPYLGLTILF